MSRPPEPVFLARDTYRRRRLQDAARFLPFLGAFLFVIPTVWAIGSRTSSGTAYLFIVWFALIIVAGLISRRLMPDVGEVPPPDAEPVPDPEAR